MSGLKRLFGSKIKSSGTFRQEPFGDGFLLQDSAGKWVAWGNEVGNELRNLEGSEVQVFGGRRVAIQGPQDAFPILWNTQQEAVVPPEYRSYQVLIPGPLFVAVISILDAFKTLLIVQRRLLSQAVEAEDEGTAALMSDCIRE